MKLDQPIPKQQEGLPDAAVCLSCAPKLRQLSGQLLDLFCRLRLCEEAHRVVNWHSFFKRCTCAKQVQQVLCKKKFTKGVVRESPTRFQRVHRSGKGSRPS